MTTKTKQLERDFFGSERNFRLLVEGITDYAIIMLDPEGRVSNWNAGARRIKGYTAKEIVGTAFLALLSPGRTGSGDAKPRAGDGPHGEALPDGGMAASQGWHASSSHPS